MDANIQNIACLGKILSEENFETWLLLRKNRGPQIRNTTLCVLTCKATHEVQFFTFNGQLTRETKIFLNESIF